MQASFSEVALILLISAMAGAVAVRLRQPPLIAYIIVGIVLGPAVLGVVTTRHQIDLLAQFGVAVLLFVVGLKLDLHHVRHIGPVALATGLGQLVFTILVGFIIVLLLGRGKMEALYVAVALTFSSTIIIVKLLSDKRELDALHGRIAVGFLIVQDLAVILAMMGMSSLRVDTTAPFGETAILLLLRIAATAFLLYLMMRYILPRLVLIMARSQELLLIFAIAWGTGLAALGEWAGFSKEAGAFLAGFSLASTPYRDAVNARLVGIRDFLLLFFFIDLGAKLDFSMLGNELYPAAILSLFVLIGNPLIVMAIMGYMGYRKRTGFLAGLTVAQISEFSIVFVAMGISLGQVTEDALVLTTMVGLTTIAISTYMILHSQQLYELLEPWLTLFERRHPYRELAMETHQHPTHPQLMIVGLGRYGGRLLVQLYEQGIRALGVDFDPEVVSMLRRRGLPVFFGDGADYAFIESLPVTELRWVVTTLPQWEDNRALFHALQDAGFSGHIAGVVRDELHEGAMRSAGIDMVINPFNNAAEQTARELIDVLDGQGS